MSNQADLPLQVQLTMPEQTRSVLTRHQGAVAIAEAYEIDCHEMAVAANDELKTMKGSLKQLEDMRKSFVAPALQIVENAKAMFNPAINALSDAEAILKRKLLAYQQAEQRKLDEARRQREEAERIARQEAAAQAAKARAEAEEKAREERRKAQEAEEQRRKAEEEGNARAAAAAAKRAAEATAKAEAVIENAEVVAQQVTLEAAALPPAVEVIEAPKLAGLSTKENWIVELAKDVDDAEAVRQIAAALATRPELVALLAIDWKNAKAMGKALKKNFNVPGLIARNDPILASRK